MKKIEAVQKRNRAIREYKRKHPGITLEGLARMWKLNVTRQRMCQILKEVDNDDKDIT